MPVPKNYNTHDENKTINSHCGYKNLVNVDRKHKLVRRYDVTDAAVHDNQAVEHLLMWGNTGAGVWADTGSATKSSASLAG